MTTPNNPFISEVYIRNFRNFLETKVRLGHKQVIIGENNVGKTNFLRALQLVLDPTFSDNDRDLTIADFHDSLRDPMETGASIEVRIEIQGYAHNSKLIAQFVDAIVSENPPTLRFTYRFQPIYDSENRIIKYEYVIFKGKREDVRFRAEDRSYINIHVIRALRDVERELKANKQSPLYKLVKKYEVAVSDLEDVSEAMAEAADRLLELDEIIHIQKTLQERFSQLSGLQRNTEITLRTFDVDIERLLYNLQVYMGIEPRPVSDLSLGMANILYICLMLMLIKDRTVPPIMRESRFMELSALPGGNILNNFYSISSRGNFILNEQLHPEDLVRLYDFMDGQNFQHQSFTILAIEEPEAHLHPILQRLLYREILHKSSTSVIFTSHSTHIASVAPISSIVHIRSENAGSEVYSSINFNMSDKARRDMERYLDAKRGELYFGKGIILVEGISEEYLIPAAAELLGMPLDDQGIIICNINSTNFYPYTNLLKLLNIPWVLFTDGDYYEVRQKIDIDTELASEERVYHILAQDGQDQHFRGHELLISLLKTIYELEDANFPDHPDEQEKYFADLDAFVGFYTLEVDIMRTGTDATTAIKKVYAELIDGGKVMRKNFENDIDSEAFWDALKKIENNISKGRFAQRFAEELTVAMIPDYIKSGLEKISKLINDKYE